MIITIIIIIVMIIVSRIVSRIVSGISIDMISMVVVGRWWSCGGEGCPEDMPNLFSHSVAVRNC